MSTIIQDDRDKTTYDTHSCLVLGTDSFMSGWGMARKGNSYAAWACKPEHYRDVLRWVENRSEMKRVRVVAQDYKPGPSCAHLHIYVVNDDHPAITGIA